MSTFERCRNPVCNNQLPDDCRVGLRRFCNKRCRLDGWILARAARLLLKVDPARLGQILELAKTNGANRTAAAP
jgi:hypothetical protein